jgi:hypothetical protein
VTTTFGGLAKRALLSAKCPDAIMKKPDYDDPDVEERWCAKQRTIIADYLRSQYVM